MKLATLIFGALLLLGTAALPLSADGGKCGASVEKPVKKCGASTPAPKCGDGKGEKAKVPAKCGGEKKAPASAKCGTGKCG